MKALYIVGTGRSGSTLLQHLLGAQHETIALGEVRQLENMVRFGIPPCACGRRVDECPFWTSVAQLLGSPLGEIRTVPATGLARRRIGQALSWGALKLGTEQPIRRLLAQEQRAAANHLAIYGAVEELTGKSVVVDSSKVPSQFLHLYLESKLVWPVFLVRDGRAVAWSKMRQLNYSAERATRDWLHAIRMMLLLKRVVRGPASNFVRYEELCRDPATVLQSILGQVGIAVRSTDLRLIPAERHDLMGSPHFYEENKSEEIELDERWRTEMPKPALVTFERIAGRMNRRLGYG